MSPNNYTLPKYERTMIPTIESNFVASVLAECMWYTHGPECRTILEGISPEHGSLHICNLPYAYTSITEGQSVVAITQFGQGAKFDPNHHNYYIVNIQDSESSDLKNHFDATTKFIHDEMNHGKDVYVHCNMGRSRSATIIIAYLMRYKKMPLVDALDFIKTKHPDVKPNSGFMNQLAHYYPN